MLAGKRLGGKSSLLKHSFSAAKADRHAISCSTMSNNAETFSTQNLAFYKFVMLS
jgi:hypothetical protein